MIIIKHQQQIYHHTSTPTNNVDQSWHLAMGKVIVVKAFHIG